MLLAFYGTKARFKQLILECETSTAVQKLSTIDLYSHLLCQVYLEVKKLF